MVRCVWTPFFETKCRLQAEQTLSISVDLRVGQ